MFCTKSLKKQKTFKFHCAFMYKNKLNNYDEL